MLKSLVGAIFLIAAWNGTNAYAGEDRALACRETEVWVNEVPLPRKYQLGVAWENMQGFWFNESRDESKRFVFDIGEVRTINRKKYFSVEMSDPLTGEVLRRGVVAVKDALRASGVVTGLTKPTNGRKSEDNLVIFRSFKEIDRLTGRPTNRSMFVVTIRRLEKARVCEETHHELLRPDGLHN